jgi:hypothetical protein
MRSQHLSNKSPAEVLNIRTYSDAQQAVLVYGEDPSMLYNMNRKDRGEYAQALIDGCVAAGMKSKRLPPLWHGIVKEPDLHETLAREYRSS